MDEKEMFLNGWEREFQTTLKVLSAYPEEKQDLRPHEKLRTAREIAWIFPSEENVFFPGILAGKLDFGNSMQIPATMGEVIEKYEEIHRNMVEEIRNVPAEELNKTMPWYVAPKTQADIRKMDILWMMLMDQVHHRGQFTIYLRMAGGKVPSIYGPTADELWA